MFSDVTCCGAMSCFPRMDDIQLCNDIMDLKQELQNLVAIPGNHLGLQLLRVPSLPHLASGLGDSVHLLS